MMPDNFLIKIVEKRVPASFTFCTGEVSKTRLLPLVNPGYLYEQSHQQNAVDARVLIRKKQFMQNALQLNLLK